MIKQFEYIARRLVELGVRVDKGKAPAPSDFALNTFCDIIRITEFVAPITGMRLVAEGGLGVDWFKDGIFAVEVYNDGFVILSYQHDWQDEPTTMDVSANYRHDVPFQLIRYMDREKEKESE